jgi:hypothetical protein
MSDVEEWRCTMKGGPKEQGRVTRLKLVVTEIHRSGLERTKSKNHNQTRTKTTNE